jgi:hypothetical protein
MILAEGATNLMQRLAHLPTLPYLGLLLRRKPIPSSLSHNTTSKSDSVASTR